MRVALFLVFSVVLFLPFDSVQAGCYLFGDKSSCGKDLVSSIGDHCSGGLAGAANCADPTNLAVMTGLNAARNAGLHPNNVEGCGAFALNIVKYGSMAVRIVAMYYGVPIPDKVMALGKAAVNQHGIRYCENHYKKRFSKSRLQSLQGFMAVKDMAPSEVSGFLDFLSDNRAMLRQGQAQPGEVSGQARDIELARLEQELELEGIRIDEQGRQFDANLTEQGRQFDARLNEDSRQFDAALAAKMDRYNQLMMLKNFEARSRDFVARYEAETDRKRSETEQYQAETERYDAETQRVLGQQQLQNESDRDQYNALGNIDRGATYGQEDPSMNEIFQMQNNRNQ